jgi:phosphoglycolate phosphatase
VPVVSTPSRSFDVDVVVFDKDGTLVDLDAVWFPPAKGWIDAIAPDGDALAGALARRLGVDLDGCRLVPDSIAAASTFEHIGDETAAELVAHGWSRDQIDAVLVRAATAVDHALGSAAPTMLADVPTLFDHLIRGGLRLALLTSDDRAPTLEFLDWLGARHLLDMVVTASDIDHPKPHPDGLRRITAELGVAADRMLMIGDSVFDRRAARAAGTWFVAVGHRSAAAHEADASVGCIDELTVD